ncbi:MAG: MFS transporter [Dehalococcoidia bacterium]|nr:MFS transporter [Dehalococcoidia bacterium]
MKRIYYGWWVVGGAFLLLFCAVGTQFYAFPVFFDVMVREMGWARTQAALAMTVGTFVAGSMGLLAGGLIHKIGLRPVMVCGTIIAGLGFFLLRTVTEPWQFYLYYGLVLSLGIAGISTVANMTAVESWFDRGKSTALGIAATGIGAGGVVMPLLAGWLISRYDWQTACTCMAGILIVVGIPISAIIMRTPQERKVAPEPAQQKGLEAGDATIGQALRQKSFWLISMSAMLWYLAYTIGLTHQVAFAVDMGIDRVTAAGAVSVLCVFSIPARLGFGKLGDVMDKRYVMMMAASLQVVAFAVLLKTTNLAMLYVYSALIGVGVGGLTPMLPGLVADYFGRRQFGAVYGALEMVTMLGIMTGPVYGGWIYDTTKSYYLAFLSGIIITLLAVVLVYLAPKPHSH